MRPVAVLLLLLPGIGSFACDGERIEPHKFDVDGPSGPVAFGQAARISVGLISTATDIDHESGWCGGSSLVMPTSSIQHATCTPDCSVTLETSKVALVS